MSERIPPSSIAALSRLGSIPFWRKRSITSVAVDPTGSNVAATGTRVSTEADVVVVEDLRDLRLLDPGHALRLLGVIHEQHPAGRGWTRSERVTSPTGRRAHRPRRPRGNGCP